MATKLPSSLRVWKGLEDFGNLLESTKLVLHFVYKSTLNLTLTSPFDPKDNPKGYLYYFISLMSSGDQTNPRLQSTL